jgi:glyoxylase-like metal-dependent hydrolase (beta-lactamase superfamily II)/ferredoxin
MAQEKRRRSQNAPGNFFVDDSCINCGTCYWMAPDTFREVDEMAAVTQQPTSPAQKLKAAQALLSCPTASIGVIAKGPELGEAAADFPLLIEKNVYHCGYHAKESFGAASYLIVRPEGNVLVDSPRFVPSLIKGIERLGGIRYLFLTHKDDVAFHQKFRDHFQCERILHEADRGVGTKDVEILLQGEAPTSLAPDLTLIPVPGHTRGHVVLLHRERYLFTGDHLAWDSANQALYAFSDACWYSWKEQTSSMKRLSGYSFEWVLPGHGERGHLSAAEMASQMQICIQRMEAHQ